VRSFFVSDIDVYMATVLTVVIGEGLETKTA
jgi:hypothetical protein